MFDRLLVNDRSYPAHDFTNDITHPTLASLSKRRCSAVVMREWAVRAAWKRRPSLFILPCTASFLICRECHQVAGLLTLAEVAVCVSAAGGAVDHSHAPHETGLHCTELWTQRDSMAGKSLLLRVPLALVILEM